MSSLGIPGTEPKDKRPSGTVRELIARLQKMDPDAVVRHIPARSSGVSDSVYPREDVGFVSQYGYVLPTRDYLSRSDDAETFPVVWI